VANAGIVLDADLSATSSDIWNRTIAVNLTGIFQTVQAAAGLMKPRRHGAIVLTASTNSYDGEASLIAYNCSKAGLLGILHTAANEPGPYQIRVNAVCLGVIRTRLAEQHFASNPGVLKDYFRHVPWDVPACPMKWPRLRLPGLGPGFLHHRGGAGVDGGQMASKFGTWSEPFGEFSDGSWRLR
jgi:NAD(P)-dependent dehydrogenase (short-subunit alcohol dehydrogenase family)